MRQKNHKNPHSLKISHKLGIFDFSHHVLVPLLLLLYQSVVALSMKGCPENKLATQCTMIIPEHNNQQDLTREIIFDEFIATLHIMLPDNINKVVNWKWPNSRIHCHQSSFLTNLQLHYMVLSARF